MANSRNNKKVTAKELNAKKQELKDIKYCLNRAKENEDWSMVNVLENSIKIIKETFFDKLPTVCIKYWIGYRQYFSSAIKIGKYYYVGNHYTKMTQKNGYRSITEIPEITEKMANQMLADSYYY